jgi:hypothetical protein
MQLYIQATCHVVLVVFDEYYTGAARGLVVRAAVPVVWMNVGINNNLHALGRRPI